MKTLTALILIALSVAASGCKTVPKEENKDESYTPHSERPPGAKDYWEDRAAQDRRENRQEAPPKAP